MAIGPKRGGKSFERWITPPEIFEPLHREFAFDLDAAADEVTARLPRYISPTTCALTSPEWPGERIWLNPPYAQKLIPFVRRAYAEVLKGKTVVALIPLRGRGAWWHQCVIGRAHEVRCVRKRVNFLRPDGTRGTVGSGTFDSCIVVWRGEDLYPWVDTKLTSFDASNDISSEVTAGSRDLGSA